MLQICRECFFSVFEDEIHNTIVENSLFKPGERVAVAASGGKGESFCPVGWLSSSFMLFEGPISLTQASIVKVP